MKKKKLKTSKKKSAIKDKKDNNMNVSLVFGLHRLFLFALCQMLYKKWIYMI